MSGLYILSVILMTFYGVSEGRIDFCFRSDPCVPGGVSVLDVIGRSTNCPFYGTNGLCDSSLTEQWYRTDTPMASTCPSLARCGTYYPLWLNGSEPAENEGMVNRTACVKGISSCCSKAYDVVLKNCSTFMAYCLQHMSGCAERYCFGDTGSCPTVPPTTTPTTQMTTSESSLPTPLRNVEQGEDQNGLTFAVIIIGITAAIAVMMCFGYLCWTSCKKKEERGNNYPLLLEAHSENNQDISRHRADAPEDPINIVDESNNVGERNRAAGRKRKKKKKKKAKGEVNTSTVSSVHDNFGGKPIESQRTLRDVEINYSQTAISYRKYEETVTSQIEKFTVSSKEETSKTLFDKSNIDAYNKNNKLCNMENDSIGSPIPNFTQLADSKQAVSDKLFATPSRSEFVTEEQKARKKSQKQKGIKTSITEQSNYVNESFDQEENSRSFFRLKDSDALQDKWALPKNPLLDVGFPRTNANQPSDAKTEVSDKILTTPPGDELITEGKKGKKLKRQNRIDHTITQQSDDVRNSFYPDNNSRTSRSFKNPNASEEAWATAIDIKSGGKAESTVIELDETDRTLHQSKKKKKKRKKRRKTEVTPARRSETNV